MKEAAWLSLLRCPGIGPRRQRALLEKCGSAAACFGLRHAELPAAAQEWLRRSPEEGLMAADWQWLENPEQDLCTWLDDDYPPLLREIDDPPMALFLRGQRARLRDPLFAIVGSRTPSPVGAATARAFAEELGSSGLVIVSGLALGIDTAAHQGALASGTLAVLGNGIDLIYPRENLSLAREILQQGLIVSEQLPGTRIHRGLFPRRNRLISGMSLGTLVVEAAESSGSLITARLALEQGREVFAIPGSIHSPLSRGPHRLIREGAKLVETARDVLEELGPLFAASRAQPTAQREPEDADERRVFAALGQETLSSEEIAQRCGLTLPALSSILMRMEIHGYIASCPGGRFCRLPYPA
ncbi:DNA-processing protein DprA [Candidatus Igneacidithiobacillus taiwanensis]|uniref:DNA-processing protein DprA n=1 Tax=Candidatus Igneacidithiobacillus taiwanensis TaxID=1945924 RepID=UPI00289AA387|nr:DNA-processing protein DprA [Candidatus Igneacidithiobacillus taiwanensis]